MREACLYHTPIASEDAKKNGGRVIMADSSLAKRLGIKAGQRVLLLDAPAGIGAALGELPAGAQMVSDGPAAVVVAFAQTRAALTAIAPRARDAMQASGSLWFAYPKLTAQTAGELKREVVWEVVAAAIDQRPVTQISIDDTWSALRFRPASEVKSRG
jgi:hypothetical protein